MILSTEKKKKLPIEDSEDCEDSAEENYYYYNEDEEAEAEEWNEIIFQLQDSGIDISALFDDSWK